MVRIRLCRVGAKKQPSYRLVVADKESPRDGRFIEIIGNYNPRTDPPTVVIKEERALYWLQHGAQPSDPVERMFKKAGIMDKLQAAKAQPAPEAPAA
jgi:small subunit ribosomal protein S16